MDPGSRSIDALNAVAAAGALGVAALVLVARSRRRGIYLLIDREASEVSGLSSGNHQEGQRVRFLPKWQIVQICH